MLIMGRAYGHGRMMAHRLGSSILKLTLALFLSLVWSVAAAHGMANHDCCGPNCPPGSVHCNLEGCNLPPPQTEAVQATIRPLVFGPPLASIVPANCHVLMLAPAARAEFLRASPRITLRCDLFCSRQI